MDLRRQATFSRRAADARHADVLPPNGVVDEPAARAIFVPGVVSKPPALAVSVSHHGLENVGRFDGGGHIVRLEAKEFRLECKTFGDWSA